MTFFRHLFVVVERPLCVCPFQDRPGQGLRSLSSRGELQYPVERGFSTVVSDPDYPPADREAAHLMA